MNLSPVRPPLAFIGIGQVGGALARALSARDYPIVLGARDPASPRVREAVAAQPRFTVTSPREAVAAASMVFLATPFAAALAVLPELHPELAGKVVVDCTNPVGAGLRHAPGAAPSGAEAIAAAAPAARIVKAFTVYGFENFVDSRYPGYGTLRPMMPLAGDDPAAKAAVAALAHDLGWEPVDCGPLAHALHLEHLALLWIKLARAGDAGANFVWARLRR